MNHFALSVLLHALSLVPTHALFTAGSFPTAVGTKWVYKISGDMEAVLTLTVTSVEKDGRERVLTLSVNHEQTSGDNPATTISNSKRRVSEKGVFYVDPFPDIPGPDLCLLQFPPKPRAKWEELYPRVDALKRTCLVTKEERIKCPAGEYRTVLVETIYELPGKPAFRFSNDWYAPGVGLVKQERHDGKRIQILTSFTPGGGE